MDIIKFCSEPPVSPFAPQWEYFMAETYITGIDWDHVAGLILQKEKQLIQTYPPIGDGYTGLGPNSLTSRHVHFNVLTWEDPEIKKIFNSIKKHHDYLLEYMNIPKRKLWINCWANVLRHGESIRQHIHLYDKYCYLGGHIVVKCENTSTVYVNPMDQYGKTETYSSTNESGKLTFFQDHIPHFTTRHLGEKERITIAFDILVDEYPNKRKNTILFDDLT
jgi:hypothetical protein